MNERRFPLPNKIWIDPSYGKHPEDWDFTPDWMVRDLGGNQYTKSKEAYVRYKLLAEKDARITELEAENERLREWAVIMEKLWERYGDRRLGEALAQLDKEAS